MRMTFVATAAVSLWLILWAQGVKSFDGFLVAVLIILIAAGIKYAWQFLPGVTVPRPTRSTASAAPAFARRSAEERPGDLQIAEVDCLDALDGRERDARHLGPVQRDHPSCVARHQRSAACAP